MHEIPHHRYFKHNRKLEKSRISKPKIEHGTFSHNVNQMRGYKDACQNITYSLSNYNGAPANTS